MRSDSLFPAASLDRAVTLAGELFRELHADLERAPVHPGGDARELARRAPVRLGEEGVGPEAALEAWRRWIVPHATRTPSPMYFGLLNTSPLPIASLADSLVSALNQNGGAVHQGPSAWVAEQEVVRAFSELVAPDAPPMRGMLLPGGTFANLQALLVARGRHLPEWSAVGPAALAGEPRIYTGEASHLSVARSAVVAGLGRSGIVSLPAVGRGAFDPAALSAAIEEDLRAGRRPFAVVATAGTTGTGALDPLEAVADVCATHGLWLHVDACYGGAALLLDELRPSFRGIERADSVALDPHKWFFLPLTSSLLLLRDPVVDLEAFDWSASYVPDDPADVGAWRRGVPMSRRASGLTVWTALRATGWGPIREGVRRNVALTRRLEAGLREEGFEVLADGELSIACARFVPEGCSASEADELQVRVAEAVCASGQAWFATVRHAGRTWLVFRQTNLRTREEHVDRLVALVSAAAREATARTGCAG